MKNKNLFFNNNNNKNELIFIKKDEIKNYHTNLTLQGKRHLYVRGKLHFEKKLREKRKRRRMFKGVDDDKGKELLDRFMWKPKSKLQKMYQVYMDNLKKTRKRPSYEPLKEMLNEVSSTEDLKYAICYWRTLCLRRIKFTNESTRIILNALKKYDEDYPKSAIECKFFFYIFFLYLINEINKMK
jgi:uncharacterized protein (UPF0248 family)